MTLKPCSKTVSTVRRGFTLIELLVVIAIIALLAAILFPVFARARENARKSSCSNNVKQIMIGIMQYTQDFDEAYPTGHSNTAPNHSWNQLVFPYVKSTQVFICPSQSGATYIWAAAVAPSGIAPRFVSTYAANYQFGRDGGQGGGRTQSDVVKPASTVYLVDSGAVGKNVGLGAGSVVQPVDTTKKKGSWILQDPAGGGGCPTCVVDPNNADWSAPYDRHLDTSNVGFADGHVKAMKYGSWYYANTPWLNPAVGG